MVEKRPLQSACALERALEVGTRADLHEPMRFVVSFQELWMTRRKFLIVFVSCMSVLRGSSSLLRGIFLGPVVMSSFLVWSSENSFYRVFQLFFFYTLAAFLVVIVPAWWRMTALATKLLVMTVMAFLSWVRLDCWRRVDCERVVALWFDLRFLRVFCCFSDCFCAGFISPE